MAELRCRRNAFARYGPCNPPYVPLRSGVILVTSTRMPEQRARRRTSDSDNPVCLAITPAIWVTSGGMLRKLRGSLLISAYLNALEDALKERCCSAAAARIFFAAA